MSKIKIHSISIANYRSFGSSNGCPENRICFPDPEITKKPTAIIGYNNVGKSNLLNCIRFGLYEPVREDTFSLKDFHDKKWSNAPELSTEFYACLEEDEYFKNGNHAINTVKIEVKDEKLTKAIDTCDVYTKNAYSKKWSIKQNAPIFYINFHKIKEEINTKRTSWGNLNSFLAKYVDKIVKSDHRLKDKEKEFANALKEHTDNAIDNTGLASFEKSILSNFKHNLRKNNCEIEYALPDFEDIFLTMVFKIGLNGKSDKLVPIDHFGDGFISMFVMAVIQAIAESETGDQCLFLFEEPESFLHESHQEYFYKNVLCSLTEKGHQVIYTTHSDKMVDIFDTQSIIRLEFDGESNRTIVTYNEYEEPISKDLFYFNPDKVQEIEKFSLHEIKDFNNYIKMIEPNLNRILFSDKVILVEGANDILAYNHIIRQKVIYKTQLINPEWNMQQCERYAETYLCFNNISIVPHHGKSTALILAQLCKHLGIKYFLINDWDFDIDFVESLKKLEVDYDKLESWDQIKMQKNKEGQAYSERTIKGMITVNKNLLGIAKKGIHFNIPKLERLIGYVNSKGDKTDKDSRGIWQVIKDKKADDFGTDIFPAILAEFIGLNSITKIDADKQSINETTSSKSENSGIDLPGVTFPF